MQEVVITGVGVVSPLGIGREAFWQSVKTAQSGVRSVELLQQSDQPFPYGGAVVDFNPKQYVRPRKSLKVMSRAIQIAFAAADLAWQDARLSEATLDPERVGVVSGSDMIYNDPEETFDAFVACEPDGKHDFSLWGELALRQLSPLWMLKYLPNMPACHISISRDMRGHCNSIVQSEVSSLLAIAEGVRTIRRGISDCMIVGGVGSRLHPTSVTWRGGVNAYTGDLPPEQASRPFDANRAGMINGEGAGMLVLESRQHATRRNATILGSILGLGSTFGNRPCGRGIKQQAIEASMQTALDHAGMKPETIGHINAHGLSTQKDDAIEAKAIASLFPQTPVTATKSYFGNLGAGGGAIELIASILGLAEGVIPPTLNYDTPDAECPINVVGPTPTPTTNRTALALNQSRLGHSASVVYSAE